MKKVMFLIVLAVALIFMTTPAMSYTNSGTYLGTFGGNVNELSDITDALTSLGISTTDTLYADTDASVNDFFLGITYAADNKSGTWFTNGTVLVNFYAVKAGSQFALYEQDPSKASGTWSTEDLLVGSGQIPKISHLAAVADSSSKVPEPATMLLLGLGLMGLAGVRRKFKK